MDINVGTQLVMSKVNAEKEKARSYRLTFRRCANILLSIALECRIVLVKIHETHILTSVLLSGLPAGRDKIFAAAKASQLHVLAWGLGRAGYLSLYSAYRTSLKQSVSVGFHCPKNLLATFNFAVLTT